MSNGSEEEKAIDDFDEEIIQHLGPNRDRSYRQGHNNNRGRSGDDNNATSGGVAEERGARQNTPPPPSVPPPLLQTMQTSSTPPLDGGYRYGGTQARIKSNTGGVLDRNNNHTAAISPTSPTSPTSTTNNTYNTNNSENNNNIKNNNYNNFNIVSDNNYPRTPGPKSVHAESSLLPDESGAGGGLQPGGSSVGEYMHRLPNNPSDIHSNIFINKNNDNHTTTTNNHQSSYKNINNQTSNKGSARASDLDTSTVSSGYPPNNETLSQISYNTMDEGGRHSHGIHSSWSRQNRARPYIPIPEMTQVYPEEEERTLHNNSNNSNNNNSGTGNNQGGYFHAITTDNSTPLNSTTNPSPPPQHTFNDPDEHYFYDQHKYDQQAIDSVVPRPSAVRLSTASIATGVIDLEDAHDGDPDRVRPVDDEFSHSTTHPLENGTTSRPSRPGTRQHNEGHYNRWRMADGRYNEELQRRLSARHLQMIALGGTIGVGLFLASAEVISLAGPLGALLGFGIMGFVVLCVMLSLGEMSALIPIAGGITAYAGRFVDDALGFAAGWMYWISFALGLPTEMTAASILIRYFSPLENDKFLGLWITVFLCLVVTTNSFNVRVYGELEYGFGLLKIVTIVGLIILMMVINAGGSPNGEHIAFKNWQAPNGPFRQYLIPGTTQYKSQFFEYPGITGSTGNFLSTWGSFTIAAFSFIGTEIVAVAGGEAKNARNTLPSAVRRLFWRIAIFYVLGIFVVSLNVPSTHPKLLQFHDSTTKERVTVEGDVIRRVPLGSHSPWVIAITSAGIPVLPGIINAIFVFCAWSAGNSHLYASSRTLYGLAVEGKAPRIFRRCTPSGVPIVAVLASASIASVAYIQCAGKTGQVVFDYLLKLTTVAGVIVWGTFCLAFIRFYYGLKQVRHIDRYSEHYPYKSPFQPYLAFIGLISCTLIVVFNGFDYFLEGRHDPITGKPIARRVDFASNFLTAYLSLFMFVSLLLFWKIYKKTSIHNLNRMNFDTGMSYGTDRHQRPQLGKRKKVLLFAQRSFL